MFRYLFRAVWRFYFVSFSAPDSRIRTASADLAFSGDDSDVGRLVARFFRDLGKQSSFQIFDRIDFRRGVRGFYRSRAGGNFSTFTQAETSKKAVGLTAFLHLNFFKILIFDILMATLETLHKVP